jgi:hypothetical protein
MPRNKSTNEKPTAAKCQYRFVAQSEIDPRGFEYFDLLPLEIQIIIFGYVPFQHILENASLVSKNWV